jgi:hypothetical protein
MKSNLLFPVIAIGMAGLISCGDNNQDTSGTNPGTNQGLTLPSTINQQDNNSQPVADPNNPNGQGTINMQPVVTADNATKPAANVKLNPPHGEPGHRCDISVGAPLDGSSQQPTTSVQPVTINPTQNTSKPATTTPTTNPGNLKINPAHGQPGHRCDIAVGAPLDGSASATTPTVQPTVQPTDNKSPLQYFQPVPAVNDKKTTSPATDAKADTSRKQ